MFYEGRNMFGRGGSMIFLAGSMIYLPKRRPREAYSLKHESTISGVRAGQYVSRKMNSE